MVVVSIACLIADLQLHGGGVAVGGPAAGAGLAEPLRAGQDLQREERGRQEEDGAGGPDRDQVIRLRAESNKL